MDGPFWFADEFCHYSNLNGLIGILENREIWLSDYRLLNDTKEISYGRELAVKVISEIVSSEQDAEFYSFLQSIVSEICKSSDKQYYICSMSLAIDELNQWRAYAKDHDGICIVFNGNEAFGTKTIYIRRISDRGGLFIKSMSKLRFLKKLLIFIGQSLTSLKVLIIHSKGILRG
jgi:hypothetical protein